MPSSPAVAEKAASPEAKGSAMISIVAPATGLPSAVLLNHTRASPFCTWV